MSWDIFNEETDDLSQMGAETEPSVVVESEQVPLLNLHASGQLLVPLDLTCQRLLPLLDGESRVWEIAQRSAVDLKVVRACVQNLGHIGAVKTVAPFRQSAAYICMPRLRRLWRDANLRQRLVEHVGLSCLSLGGAYCTANIGRC